jgi:hypothetical protein
VEGRFEKLSGRVREPISDPANELLPNKCPDTASVPRNARTIARCLFNLAAVLRNAAVTLDK